MRLDRDQTIWPKHDDQGGTAQHRGSIHATHSAFPGSNLFRPDLSVNVENKSMRMTPPKKNHHHGNLVSLHGKSFLMFFFIFKAFFVEIVFLLRRQLIDSEVMKKAVAFNCPEHYKKSNFVGSR